MKDKPAKPAQETPAEPQDSKNNSGVVLNYSITSPETTENKAKKTNTIVYKASSMLASDRDSTNQTTENEPEKPKEKPSPSGVRSELSGNSSQHYLIHSFGNTGQRSRHQKSIPGRGRKRYRLNKNTTAKKQKPNRQASTAAYAAPEHYRNIISLAMEIHPRTIGPLKGKKFSIPQTKEIQKRINQIKNRRRKLFKRK